MAFPLPEHLPRTGFSNDAFGSSSSNAEPFLKRIASTPAKDFKAATASIWVRDIDQAIGATKDSIRSRVQADVGLFQRQLESSTQAQTRLTSLSRSVEDLDESLNDPRNGVLPSLLNVLASHSELAQRSSDIQVRKVALDHLRNLRDAFQDTMALEQEGKLPEAVVALQGVKALLDTSPEPLSKAKVLGEAKRRFRTVEDSLQERVASAYGELIVFDTSLRVKQSVQVRGSTNVVQMEPLLASISPDKLAANLASLRKDLLSKLIVPALSREGSITISESGPSSFVASFSAGTGTDVLQGLQHLIAAFHRCFVVVLPLAHRGSFPATVYQPIAQAILSNLLEASMPSTLSDLPPYLHLVKTAVQLEQEITKTGFTSGRGRLVNEWAEDVGGHYEKRRRQTIISTARDLIEDVHGAEVGVGIRIEVQESPQTSEESSPSSGVVINNASDDNEESAWGFDDEPGPSQPQEQVDQDGGGDDGWGFDDDAEPQVRLSPRDDESSGGATVPSSAAESTPGDGWGWEDDAPAEPEPSTFGSVAAKPARGLEKHTGARSINANSAASGATFGSSTQPSHLTSPSTVTKVVRRSPETYLISSRATKILAVAKRCLDNGKQIMDSKIFPEHTPPRGNLLLSTSPAILDLYRALYPAVHAPDLSTITNQDEFVLKTAESLQFSNDCRYLADQLQWLVSIPDYELVKEKLRDSQDRMKSASALALQLTVDEGVRRVLAALKGTRGFVETGDDTRVPGYRDALEEVRDEIESVAVKWRTVLTRSSYLDALGTIVDRSLAKVVADIIDLHDIPEEESHRLRSLLEVLAPLEALFMDEEISTVVLHVPSWLKFSYLSELLEASMADISYLFDEGALIDFSTDELVSLIRGLFADTPLRARTIEKISLGHPVHD